MGVGVKVKGEGDRGREAQMMLPLAPMMARRIGSRRQGRVARRPACVSGTLPSTQRHRQAAEP